jgi:L-2-hydroxyglutarate oxidase LhgO
MGKYVPVRCVIVGAGILGLATARELSRRDPDVQVTVVEKESAVAQHQTSHNSGVVHAGLYYPPGSLKARLCTEGRGLLKDFCAERGLVFEECGKVVVARDPSELPALRQLESRSVANAVPGLRWLGPAELAELEPHAAGVAAIHSPHTAIVDFTKIAQTMATDLDVRTGFDVVSIRTAGAEVVVGARDGREFAADRVVVCAGLHADVVARLAGDPAGPAIVPFRGEYWRLVPSRAHLVRGLVYPVPDPRYPFLGVHFTKRVDGSVDVGPNAVLALAREGYRRRDVVAAEVGATLRQPGFRRMVVRNWWAGVREMRTSLSKRAFAAAAARLVPVVRPDDLVAAPSGVRAQAVDADGSLVDDFRISRAGGRGQIMVVRNAPSPGATSSLAIAGYIVDRLVEAVG